MKMENEHMTRHKRLMFQVLRVAVENRELRFKGALKLAEQYGEVKSRKAVSHFLKNMVEDGYLEKKVSEKTKRSIYGATLVGAKYYWLVQAFNWLRSFMSRYKEVHPTSDSAEDLMKNLEDFSLGLLSSFFLFLPTIKDIRNEEHRANIAGLYIDYLTEAQNKIWKEITDQLIQKEDLAKSCKKWVAKYFYPKLKEFKGNISKLPEVSLVYKILDEFLRNG